MEEAYRAVAYVTAPASGFWRWIGQDAPGAVASGVDTRFVTHVHFAFGMIAAQACMPAEPGRPIRAGRVVSKEAYWNEAESRYRFRVTLDGWIEEMRRAIDGSAYLQALVALKAQKPSLKVVLSIGGWEADGFCYMARTREGRADFIASCVELVRAYRLDGVDIDWEFPTDGGAGAIAWCEHCVDDARALMRELRAAFDAAFSEHKLLSVAIAAADAWVDAPTLAVLDCLNVMCYDFDLEQPDAPHADMARSTQYMLAQAARLGDNAATRAKLNLGIPFYNGGGPTSTPFYQPFGGKAVDASVDITREKMRWVRANGFGGALYWAYSMDVFEQDAAPGQPVKQLQRAVYETLNKEAQP